MSYYAVNKVVRNINQHDTLTELLPQHTQAHRHISLCRLHSIQK